VVVESGNAVLAIWEVEIGKITVLGQPVQRAHETPSQQNNLGMVVHACHPSYGRKPKNGRTVSRQKARPYLKSNQSKKGLEEWFKGYRTCLVPSKAHSTTQIPVPPKKILKKRECWMQTTK
jgi:hypothetical protein